jgi:hypothetical protein
MTKSGAGRHAMSATSKIMIFGRVGTMRTSIVDSLCQRACIAFLASFFTIMIAVLLFTLRGTRQKPETV